MPLGVSPLGPGFGTKIQYSAALACRGSYTQCPAVATTLWFLAATELAEHQYSLSPNRKKTLPMVLATLGPLRGSAGAVLRAAVERLTAEGTADAAWPEGAVAGLAVAVGWAAPGVAGL